MKGISFLSVISALISLFLIACSSVESKQPQTVASSEVPVLNFQLEEGRNLSAFYRSGSNAAHVIASNGNQPRLITAFPAGNSGIGFWFKATNANVEWNISENIQPWEFVAKSANKEQQYHGITTRLTVTGNDLYLDKAVMGSIRVLREYQRINEVPSEVDKVRVDFRGKQVKWQRNRLDDKAGYQATIEVTEGNVQFSGNEIQFLRSEQGKLSMVLKAATSETPLTPLLPLKPEYASKADSKLTNSLAFLTYEEKMLAGSWRFLTYFGRDTLLSLRMLMPAMTNDAIEAVLGSVLERMSTEGRVAHEEDIGEFAVLRNYSNRRGASDTPLYDYSMLDDDLMLLPIISQYLLSVEPKISNKFLSRTRHDGMSYGAILSANLQYIVHSAKPFYLEPKAANLIGLPEGHYDGNWRDSEEGLGGAKFPFDVNAVLVPAALASGAQLLEAGLLSDIVKSGELHEMAAHWQEQVPSLYLTSVAPEKVSEQLNHYSKQLGLPKLGVNSIGAEPLSFFALALEQSGKPLPVIHSDTGFMLLFGQPNEQQLSQILNNVQAPFPLGLMTPVGMLVSNPAFTGAVTQELFGVDKYHGSVVWSWQQAMMLVGIERQLQRSDLSKATLVKLTSLRKTLWQAVKATEKLKTSELWSWSVQDGQYQMEAFGQRRTDITESNPAQLWSTVFIAINE